MSPPEGPEGNSSPLSRAGRLTCADRLALQHHPVEDEADVLGRLGGAGSLLAQQVQDLGGQHRVLAILDELAQVGQASLFALRVLLNDADDAIHDGPLVLEAALRDKKAPRLLTLMSTSRNYTLDFHHLFNIKS